MLEILLYHVTEYSQNKLSITSNWQSIIVIHVNGKLLEKLFFISMKLVDNFVKLYCIVLFSLYCINHHIVD